MRRENEASELPTPVHVTTLNRQMAREVETHVIRVFLNPQQLKSEPLDVGSAGSEIRFQRRSVH
jgi:cell division ATPase FtsA